MRNRAFCSGASGSSDLYNGLVMDVELAPQAGADYIRPFQIEGLGIRGRAVRLSAVADEIIHKHAYPARRWRACWRRC